MKQKKKVLKADILQVMYTIRKRSTYATFYFNNKVTQDCLAQSDPKLPNTSNSDIENKTIIIQTIKMCACCFVVWVGFFHTKKSLLKVKTNSYPVFNSFQHHVRHVALPHTFVKVNLIYYMCATENLLSFTYPSKQPLSFKIICLGVGVWVHTCVCV